MASDAARLLDELMGTTRDALDASGGPEVDWEDDKVGLSHHTQSVLHCQSHCIFVQYTIVSIP